MGQMIQRDADFADDLVAFWDGDAPSEGDQASVEPGDRLLIIDDEGLVAAFDAGRHALKSYGEVDVVFVSQKRHSLENDGELVEEELETGYVLRATVQVRDAAKMVELIAMVIEQEQTVEDWLADEIAIDAATAADDVGVDLADLEAERASVMPKAIARANEVLADHGIELLSIEELEYGDFEDD